jgi:hypothetical protein
MLLNDGGNNNDIKIDSDDEEFENEEGSSDDEEVESEEAESEDSENEEGIIEEVESDDGSDTSEEYTTKDVEKSFDPDEYEDFYEKYAVEHKYDPNHTTEEQDAEITKAYEQYLEREARHRTPQKIKPPEPEQKEEIPDDAVSIISNTKSILDNEKASVDVMVETIEKSIEKLRGMHVKPSKVKGFSNRVKRQIRRIVEHDTMEKAEKIKRLKDAVGHSLETLEGNRIALKGSIRLHIAVLEELRKLYSS